ncbi:uncharacterized protein LOC141904144 [Tubulanus polymorphus]|uniref:uncharacterized protein LOC141904144 n=1 Tax=Tubulanus polymorphus TaxID=672921 RepID=UPI003DA4FD70
MDTKPRRRQRQGLADRRTLATLATATMPDPCPLSRSLPKTSGLFNTSLDLSLDAFSMIDAGRIHTDVDAIDTPELRFENGFDFKSVLNATVAPNIVELYSDDGNAAARDDCLVSPSDSEKLFFDSAEDFTDLDALIAQVSGNKPVITDLAGDFSVAEENADDRIDENGPDRKRSANESWDFVRLDEKRAKPEVDDSAEIVVASTSTAAVDCRSIIPHAIPSTKYVERRIKNNIASRKSRQNRKNKFQLMEQQAVDLETENVRLKRQVKDMEETAKQMKKALVDHLAKKRN